MGNSQGDTRTVGWGVEPGEQHAHDLANKIRELAATDPQLARDLVDQLIAGLDRATDGAFHDQLYAGGAAPATVAPGTPELDGWAHRAEPVRHP
jgi:hypothetical protein